MARPSKLESLSLADLHKEMRRRERAGRALLRRRQRLASAIAAIDKQIADLGLSVQGNGSIGRTRPRNEMNLVEALSKVLDGKTMSVTDAAEAVQRAGYKTSSRTFRTIVNIALINSGRFKRVSRGQYTAK